MTKSEKRFSKQNEDSQYFTAKGVLFRITGIRLNINGSTTYTVKNTTKKGHDAFKEVGEDVMKQLID